MNEIFADLHVHIGRSENGKPIKITAAKSLNFANIAKECFERKGIDVVGIIDCASPYVIEDIENFLKTGEAYTFWENPIKKYSIDQGGIITNLPTSQMYTTDEKTRLTMASMPVLWIGTDKYGEKDCYVINMMGYKDYIDKETGLLLASFIDNKPTRMVEYEFGEVTDEDVAKPDLSQYEYME